MENIIKHYEITNYRGRGYDLVGDFKNQVSIIIDQISVGVYDFIKIMTKEHSNAQIRNLSEYPGSNTYGSKKGAVVRAKYYKDTFYQFPWQEISPVKYYCCGESADGKRKYRYFLGNFKGIENVELGIIDIIDALERMEKGSCAIIMEPELHLHICQQEKLIEEIYRIANEKEIQVIVYTQSPHIVSGHFDDVTELYRDHEG